MDNIKWIKKDGVITGLVVDDFEWTIQDVIANPTLHELYHQELKRGQDEKTLER